MKSLLIVLFVALALVLPASAQEVFEDSTPFIERTYELFVPERAEGEDSLMPLLIMLHGAGGTGERSRGWLGLDELAQADGVVVVYPDGLFNNWDFGGGVTTPNGIVTVDDVGYITWLVDTLAQAYPIDTTQVYAAGMSNGAQMAYYLTCQEPLRFGGIIGVAAPLSGVTISGCLETPTPMLYFHGTADPILPWEPRGSAVGTIISLGVAGTLQFWAERNGCAMDGAGVTNELLEDTNAEDNTTVRLLRLRDCAENGQIDFYGIVGGGHTWPGRPFEVGLALGALNMDIDASTIIFKWIATLQSAE
jgi:polyhydroxybutyrate depolymerase